MAIVIDASAALSFIAANQKTSASEAFREGAAAAEGLIAPHVFTLEMRHALLKLERRALVGAAALDADLYALESMIEIAAAPSGNELLRLIGVARTEALGLYDAAYLDLALTRGETLASRDRALLDAAGRRGVRVNDLR